MPIPFPGTLTWPKGKRIKGNGPAAARSVRLARQPRSSRYAWYVSLSMCGDGPASWERGTRRRAATMPVVR